MRKRLQTIKRISIILGIEVLLSSALYAILATIAHGMRNEMKQVNRKEQSLREKGEETR